MTRTTQPTTKVERDEWRINGWGAHGFPERLLDDADELDALRRRVAAMRQSLLRYGRHDDEDVGPQPCRSHECGPDTCDCGLDAALSASPPATPDLNADKDAAAIRHLQLENDGLRSMLNRVRDVLRDMHDPADLGAKIAAEREDADAAIVRRLEEWHSRWADKNSLAMPSVGELLDIARDAAALRAGAGGGA